ncbi:hypothetical protein BH11PSE5_BH11PSE5_15370 [soil metagenome]
MTTVTPNVHADEDHGKDRASDTQDRPMTTEENLDETLEDSMDASDAPSITHPSDKGDPVPSSGFPEDTDKSDNR